MTHIAILGMFHETNSFALEENDALTATVQLGPEVLSQAHPKSFIGGFVDGARRPGVEFAPIAFVDFLTRGGTIHARVFEHYLMLMLDGLRAAGPLDAVYFCLHGAMAVQAPYADSEASLIRAVRGLLGERMPMVATYDLHGNYTDWEVSAAVPFPMNTNPHYDGYERGVEAAEFLFRMLAGTVHPVTRMVHVPIVGPNIGQSTWSQIPAEERQLPMYQLNVLREELERTTPGLINLTIQAGYGYSDVPYMGMSVIATTDGDPQLAEKLAKQLAGELWARRDQIRTVRPIVSIDEGVQRAMAQVDGLTCLVDLGDDPGSLTPADSPAVLESLLRLGARNATLFIRDANVVDAAMQAGVGAELTLEAGASIDRRFYKPLRITGHVKLIDDGDYVICGPAHGGWGRDVRREAFQTVSVGPRVVLRTGNKIDVIFGVNSPRLSSSGKDRDYFKSVGIVLEEKQIIAVKSNQAHRASFDPIVAATYNLASPGIATVDYASLPFRNMPRPMYPLDLDMQWKP